MKKGVVHDPVTRLTPVVEGQACEFIRCTRGRTVESDQRERRQYRARSGGHAGDH
jgi:hypothetical protein